MDGKLPLPNPNLPYREDCWSEGETAALVDAWGSRYLDLNRGSLRQPQWREVADAINSRPGASARRHPPRTDIQCKNRVDTLKKKYKAERTRGGPSSWSFYGQLDLLVGPRLSGSKKRGRWRRRGDAASLGLAVEDKGRKISEELEVEDKGSLDISPIFSLRKSEK